MISGKMQMINVSCEKRICLFLAAFLCALSFAVHASVESQATTLDVSTLLELRAAISSTDGEFVQSVSSPLLSSTLEAQGTIRYNAPDFLSISIRRPEPALIEISADRLKMQDGEDVYLGGSANPPDGITYLIGLRAFLAGDEATLQQYYSIKITGNMESWIFQLKSRREERRHSKARERNEIASGFDLKIFGKEAEIAEMHVTGPSGEHIHLEVTQSLSRFR